MFRTLDLESDTWILKLRHHRQVLKCYGPVSSYAKGWYTNLCYKPHRVVFHVQLCLAVSSTATVLPANHLYRVCLPELLSIFVPSKNHFLWNFRHSQQCVNCLESFLSLSGVSPHHMFHCQWTFQATTSGRIRGPFWATRLLCYSALMRDLFSQSKNRWCEANYHSVVLPFSFPLFVFLVMLYLHLYPTIRGRCHLCSLTPRLSTSFPKFEWKYCGLSNAADSGSNPGSGICELRD